MLDIPARREPWRTNPNAPAPHAARFYWTCSYKGTVWFEASDDQWGRFTLELRETADPYEPGNWNYTREDYEQDIVASVGVLHASRPDCDCVIRPETVAAFNAWRLAEHARVVAFMDAQPDRYLFPPDDIMRQPPTVARGGFWRDGWRLIETTEQHAEHVRARDAARQTEGA